jgi:D-glycero-alpha-D-manno-heptose-7-phosphate kinase
MAERLLFGVAGGWQDQYACSFGGFNLIEFKNTETVVNPIRLDPDIVSELECSLALVNTKRSRDSGKLHQNHTEDQSTEKEKTLTRMVDFCRKMHRHLIKGELTDFGIGLNEAWELKRNAFPGATDPSVDAIYECAKQAGALGGKLLGGGLGGYFLFFVDPGQRPYLAAELESKFGLQVERIFFENHGARSWRAPN